MSSQAPASPPGSEPTPARRITDAETGPTTVIGPGTRIKGYLSGEDSVDMRGTLEGDSRITGLYRVDRKARVVGDVTATSIVVPLQNGIEADRLLSARFPNVVVLPAVVYVGATVDRPGVIRHVASGTIGIGANREADASHLNAVRDVLARTGQPVHISNDIQRERWRKLMWNVAFNTLSSAYTWVAKP